MRLQVRRELASLRAEVERALAPDNVRRYRADPPQLMRDAGFTPDPWQEEFLRSTDRWNLMLCARQVGKSLTVSMRVLLEVLTVPGSLTVIVAQREDQAAEMLRKAVTAFYRIGAPLAVKAEGATHFELVTGARVLALPAKESAVHGPTATLLVLDEAARIPDPVFFAASPQLSASGGRLIALSTAFAKTGWFYKQWCEGIGYRRWSITARECPRHSREFLERERRSMGDRWYAMAYENQFGDDVAAVFSTDDIRAARSAEVLPLFPVPGTGPAAPAERPVLPLFP
jgi:hypothetical protein